MAHLLRFKFSLSIHRFSPSVLIVRLSVPSSCGWKSSAGFSSLFVSPVQSSFGVNRSSRCFDFLGLDTHTFGKDLLKYPQGSMHAKLADFEKSIYFYRRSLEIMERKFDSNAFAFPVKLMDLVHNSCSASSCMLPMSKLRLLMICCIAKPEEVLIVEDANGYIVRETMTDNDMIVQYKKAFH